MADDVVQETLLRVDSARSARAWPFTVAGNLVIDDRRSAARPMSFAPTHFRRHDGDDSDALLELWLVTDALAEEHRAVIVHAYLRRPFHR